MQSVTLTTHSLSATPFAETWARCTVMQTKHHDLACPPAEYNTTETGRPRPIHHVRRSRVFRASSAGRRFLLPVRALLHVPSLSFVFVNRRTCETSIKEETVVILWKFWRYNQKGTRKLVVEDLLGVALKGKGWKPNKSFQWY